jgi:hypothetical protein
MGNPAQCELPGDDTEAWRHSMPAQSNLPTGVCAWCGEAFNFHRAREVARRRYCSSACGNASRVRPATVRFWDHVEKTSTCWLWTGDKIRHGYGHIRSDARGRQRTLAHRLSWSIHFGEIPAGIQVCHHCDNPPCVRPDHLFLGTQQDNMRDMLFKGRVPTGDAHVWRRRPELVLRGSRAPRAKLTEEQVDAIREARKTDHPSYSQLAKQYGVTIGAIGSIIRGDNWRHLIGVDRSHPQGNEKDSR